MESCDSSICTQRQSQALVAVFRCLSFALVVFIHLPTRPPVSLVHLLMKLKHISDQQHLKVLPSSQPSRKVHAQVKHCFIWTVMHCTPSMCGVAAGSRSIQDLMAALKQSAQRFRQVMGPDSKRPAPPPTVTGPHCTLLTVKLPLHAAALC